MKVTPSKKNVEVIPPASIYLNPAENDFLFSSKLIKAYVEIDTISRNTNILKRSRVITNPFTPIINIKYKINPEIWVFINFLKRNIADISPARFARNNTNASNRPNCRLIERGAKKPAVWIIRVDFPKIAN